MRLKFMSFGPFQIVTPTKLSPYLPLGPIQGHGLRSQKLSPAGGSIGTDYSMMTPLGVVAALASVLTTPCLKVQQL